MVIKSKPQLDILKYSLCAHINYLREVKSKAEGSHLDEVIEDEKKSFEMLNQTLAELNQIDEEENA